LQFPLHQQRPSRVIGLVVLQLIVGTLNLVIGILVMSSYSSYFSSTAQAVPRENLLDTSVLSFVFGTLAFLVAGLTFLTLIGTRFQSPEPEMPTTTPNPAYNPTYSTPINQPTPPPTVYQPQISTRAYVTQIRRTVREQAIVSSELACPICGREIFETDNFCDVCGASTRLSFQTTIMQYSDSGLTTT